MGKGCLCLGGTPIMWPIQWCIWCYLPLNRMTGRCLWKHYLPATTVAGGNKKEIVLRGVLGSCHYFRGSVLTIRLICKARSLMDRFDGNWLRRANTVSWIPFLFFCKHLVQQLNVLWNRYWEPSSRISSTLYSFTCSGVIVLRLKG